MTILYNTFSDNLSNMHRYMHSKLFSENSHKLIHILFIKILLKILLNFHKLMFDYLGNITYNEIVERINPVCKILLEDL